MIVVEGEKSFNAKIDKNGHINKRLKGFEGRDIYIVILPQVKLPSIFDDEEDQA